METTHITLDRAEAQRLVDLRKEAAELEKRL